MKLSSEPGVLVSGGVHAALLLVTLVAFTSTPKFEDAQEAVPVEVVTDKQFNEIMKGEKTAKAVQPTPQAAKPAEPVVTKPAPPDAVAKTDVTPPPPPKREKQQEEDDTPEPPAPKPPVKVAAVPPEPPKAEPKPEPPKVEPKEAEIVQPPPRPKPPEKKPELKPDQVAKLLEQKKAEEPKPAAKPKSSDEDPSKKFDPTNISKLLNKDQPARKASTAPLPTQTASLGTPTASAARMSPSLWGQLDGLLQEQYKQCWNYLGLGQGPKYVPQIRVAYTPDGKLIGDAALINPPSDPQLRTLADSALRAVRRCNPLKIPAQYQPYYEQWKARILRFDPEEMAG